MQNIDWFHSLISPPLTPPDWIFAPIWTMLYIMLLFSFFIFIKEGFTKVKKNSKKLQKIALVFFFTQLFLNLSWSSVFFGMKNIFSALIILFFIWLFTLIASILFFKFSKLAGVLLIPYLIWLTLALYLNLGYFVIN